MRKVYLDHNIIHYLVVGYPQGYDPAAEHEALKFLTGEPNSVRFVLSLWNIVEASREKVLGRVDEFASLMEGLNPLWAMERRNIQCEELRAYIFCQWFGKEPRQPLVLCSYLSQVTHALVPNEPARIGENVRNIIKDLTGDPQRQKTIRDAEALTPAALTGLQEARQNGHITPELEEETYRRWFEGYLPERGPENKPIVNEERSEILRFCIAHLNEVFEFCPCLKAEEYLSRYRTQNPGRHPERQDTIDLMHMVVALGYCDAVITGDGYLRDQAMRYRREVLPSLIVAKGLSGLKRALDSTADPAK
jgi:hypothetical protein